MRIEIIKQAAGRFDRRFGIGPVVWPFFDLLWIHTGAVRIRVGEHRAAFDLTAPGGIVIFPGIGFEGYALGDGADASVTHFGGGPFDGAPCGDGFLLCNPGDDALALQGMVNLSLSYSGRGAAGAVQHRLLQAILDGFRAPAIGKPRSRLERMWREAGTKLADIRGLADVAALAGLSESALRASHRAEFGAPAGRHLQELRLKTAERLLATTGMSVCEISRTVGYGHPESFSAAFKRSRNVTPLSHRRRCQRLA